VKAIIDSHALIWAVDEPERLASQAREVIGDSTNEILFSSGSIWELAIKVGLSKLILSLPFDTWMRQAVTDLRLTILPITICADVQSKLDNHHRDPFDRLLVAHARVWGVPIISSDPIFDRYGIQRIW